PPCATNHRNSGGKTRLSAVNESQLAAPCLFKSSHRAISCPAGESSSAFCSKPSVPCNVAPLFNNSAAAPAVCARAASRNPGKRQRAQFRSLGTKTTNNHAHASPSKTIPGSQIPGCKNVCGDGQSISENTDTT